MIRIRLEKWQRVLAFQIIGQSSHLRATKVSGRTIIFDDADKSGWTLISDVNPELDPSDRTLYIRGHLRSTDLDLVVIKCGSNEVRDKLYEELLELFKNYNNRDQEITDKESQTIFDLK